MYVKKFIDKIIKKSVSNQFSAKDQKQAKIIIIKQHQIKAEFSDIELQKWNARNRQPDIIKINSNKNKSGKQRIALAINSILLKNGDH